MRKQTTRQTLVKFSELREIDVKLKRESYVTVGYMQLSKKFGNIKPELSR